MNKQAEIDILERSRFFSSHQPLTGCRSASCQWQSAAIFFYLFACCCLPLVFPSATRLVLVDIAGINQ